MVDYDVIIIGGRPAGSTLAARLGKQKLKVLMVERSTLPSLPAVSCPIIYSATMAMLDEIGAPESEYAAGTPKIERMVQAINPDLQTAIRLPEAYGRDYGYAVDRARFDCALWNNALRYLTVTGWQNFSVTDLLWEGDTVVGIVGKGEDREEKKITARLVVGADGRFSLVARKVNAQTRDEYLDYPASIYYAYWRNLKPYDNGTATAVAYAGEPGYGYLVMDSADNTAAVAVEGQAALFEDVKDAEAYYLDLLNRNPLIEARLEGAEMVTTVRGMKKIGNLYREAGGKGWALVGDAYHQKDPLDGQGIYNAVFSAKALAHAIQKWNNGEMNWAGAVEWYDETVRIKTYSTYKALLTRVQGSLYAPAPPEWVVDKFSRWVMDDPDMQDLMGKLLTRQIPADMMTLMTPPVIAKAMIRGGLRDLQKGILERLGVKA
jgi:flavin-dependent dehydrogenase